MPSSRRLICGMIAVCLAMGTICSLISVFLNKRHRQTYYILTPRKVQTGLFSVFNMVIGSLDFYEKNACGGLEIDFADQGLYYESHMGPNWWSYYFEPIELGSKKKANIRSFSSKEKRKFTLKAEFELPIERAHQLIEKHIRLKPALRKKIETFYTDHFAGHTVIGVHYRGTDKVKEAPSVPYEKVDEEVSEPSYLWIRPLGEFSSLRMTRIFWISCKKNGRTGSWPSMPSDRKMGVQSIWPKATIFKKERRRFSIASFYPNVRS